MTGSVKLLETLRVCRELKIDVICHDHSDFTIGAMEKWQKLPASTRGPSPRVRVNPQWTESFAKRAIGPEGALLYDGVVFTGGSAHFMNYMSHAGTGRDVDELLSEALKNKVGIANIAVYDHGGIPAGTWSGQSEYIQKLVNFNKALDAPGVVINLSRDHIGADSPLLENIPTERRADAVKGIKDLRASFRDTEESLYHYSTHKDMTPEGKKSLAAAREALDRLDLPAFAGRLEELYKGTENVRSDVKVGREYLITGFYRHQIDEMRILAGRLEDSLAGWRKEKKKLPAPSGQKEKQEPQATLPATDAALRLVSADMASAPSGPGRTPAAPVKPGRNPDFPA